MIAQKCLCGETLGESLPDCPGSFVVPKTNPPIIRKYSEKCSRQVKYKLASILRAKKRAKEAVPIKCGCEREMGFKAPSCPGHFMRSKTNQQYATECRETVARFKEGIRRELIRAPNWNPKPKTSNNLCICCGVRRVGNSRERTKLCWRCYTFDGCETLEDTEFGINVFRKETTRKVNEYREELKDIIPTKHWNIEMGMEKLAEMFPEYVP